MHIKLIEELPVATSAERYQLSWVIKKRRAQTMTHGYKRQARPRCSPR